MRWPYAAHLRLRCAGNARGGERLCWFRPELLQHRFGHFVDPIPASPCVSPMYSAFSTLNEISVPALLIQG